MDLLFFVDRATSASQHVAAKINSLIGLDVPDANTLMKELLSTGRLSKKYISVLVDANFPILEA